MPAPFVLPDRITIYDQGGGVIATDYPARVVPAFFYKGYFICNAGSPMIVYGPNYWVDVETDFFIQDAGVYDIGFKQDFTGPVWSIEHDSAGRLLKLQIDWVEERYTNTDRNYTRIYCTRLDRTPS